MTTVIISHTLVENWYRSRTAHRWVVLLDGEPAWVHTTGAWDDTMTLAAFTKKDGQPWEFDGVYENKYQLLKSRPGRIFRTGQVDELLLVDLYCEHGIPLDMTPRRKGA